jgi:dimethylargininase
MLNNEGCRLTRVIVCTPREEYFKVSSLHAHNLNEVSDPRRTREQHNHLKSLLTDHGAEVIDVPELENHPNSVFTRDVALSTPGGYIKLRMGLPSRRGEEDWMAEIFDSLAEPCVGAIQSPASVEGGDIILAGKVAFVGRSERTNDEGIRQISRLLGEMGYEVRTIRVQGSLHIGGLMSAIGPERIVCCRDLFPQDAFKGFDTLAVELHNPSSANVICMDENEVIANSAENSATIQKLEERGVRVHGIDLSEFRKGAGGPTCLVLPVDRNCR